MNPKGEYDPWYRQSEDFFVKRAFSRAMERMRSETDWYKFRTWNEGAIHFDVEAEKRKIRKPRKKPSRLRPIDALISEEMSEIQRSKFELFEAERQSGDLTMSKWKDRHSLLAAPLGAEVFLSTERGGPDVMLGGAAYFGDEIFKSEEIPNARKRFPYSESANAAAKTMTYKLAAYINKKNFAAGKIQLAYRTFKIRKHFKKTLHDYHVSACKVQYFFRLRRARVQFRQQKKAEYLATVILIQSVWRMAVGVRRKWLLRLRKKNHNARLITRWIRRQLKRYRRKRGTERRRLIHAVRLQSFYRGYRVRLDLWYKRKAQTAIAIRWRYYFRKKYLKFIIKLWRGVRNKALIRQVVKIQRFFRKWKRNRSLFQVRVHFHSQQRTRGHYEQQAIAKAVREELIDKPTSWFALTRQCIDENNVQIENNPVQLFEIMSRMIIRCEGGVENLVTLEELLSMNMEQRINLAILACFCNRPNICIDYISWEICKKYFQEESFADNAYGGIIKSISKLNAIEIKSLALILKPDPKLLIQVVFLRRLTNRILIEACLVRQFTVRLHTVCLNAMAAFRADSKTHGPVSPHSCPHCFEVFMWKFQYNKHLRLVYDSNGRPQGDISRPCFRNSMLSWINRDLLRPALDLLVKRTSRRYINHFFKTLLKMSITVPERSKKGEKLTFVDSWSSSTPAQNETSDAEE